MINARLKVVNRKGDRINVASGPQRPQSSSFPSSVCLKMSVHAVIEFAVGLSTFRNIDILHQGAYAIRVAVTVKTAEKTVQAFPFALGVSHTRKRIGASHCILPAVVDETSATALSRVFLIRYVDEVVFLLDFIQFRVSLDSQALSTATAHITFQLLYGDVPTQGSEAALREMVLTTDLAVVAKSEVKLKDVATCRKTLLPIVFEGGPYSRVGVVLHSALIDFQCLETEEEDESNSSSEFPRNLATTLFASPESSAFVSCAKADSVYKSFISRLSKSYKSLRKVYKSYTEHSHVASWRALSVAYHPPHLSLPGSPVQLPYASGKTSLLSSIASSTDPNVLSSSSDSDSMSDIAEETPQVSCTFSTRVASRDPVQLATTLALEISVVSAQIRQLWTRTLDLVKANVRAVESVLSTEMDRQRSELLSGLVARTEKQVPSFQSLSAVRDMQELDRKATQMREAFARRHADHILLQTEIAGGPPYATLFEEVIVKCPIAVHGMTPLPCIEVSSDESVSFSSDSEDASTVATTSRKHVVVLVHGFHGAAYDMLVIRRFFGLYYPHVSVLMSNSNENRTDDDIEEMGKRLAEEVRDFLVALGCVGCLKLSFIGHSLGGLIVRAAVPMLGEYLYAMNTYISLGTPHMGYFDSSSKLVSTGLWLMQAWGRSTSLAQLVGRDQRDPAKCFLSRLASNQSLSRFRNILLVASHQDTYVPFESARIELSPQCKKPSIQASLFESILTGMRTTKLQRFDIMIPVAGQLLDNWIGRTAHVQLLECPTAIAALLTRCQELFS